MARGARRKGLRSYKRGVPSRTARKRLARWFARAAQWCLDRPTNLAAITGRSAPGWIELTRDRSVQYELQQAGLPALVPEPGRPNVSRLLRFHTLLYSTSPSRSAGRSPRRPRAPRARARAVGRWPSRAARAAELHRAGSPVAVATSPKLPIARGSPTLVVCLWCSGHRGSQRAVAGSHRVLAPGGTCARASPTDHHQRGSSSGATSTHVLQGGT